METTGHRVIQTVCMGGRVRSSDPPMQGLDRDCPQRADSLTALAATRTAQQHCKLGSVGTTEAHLPKQLLRRHSTTLPGHVGHLRWTVQM